MSSPSLRRAAARARRPAVPLLPRDPAAVDFLAAAVAEYDRLASAAGVPGRFALHRLDGVLLFVAADGSCEPVPASRLFADLAAVSDETQRWSV